MLDVYNILTVVVTDPVTGFQAKGDKKWFINIMNIYSRFLSRYYFGTVKLFRLPDLGESTHTSYH